MISGLPARPALTPLSAATAFAVAAVALTTAAQATDAAAQARSDAQAGQSRSLRERLFGRNLPAIGRYVSESGESFILDQSGARPLLRFESRQETWVLRPSSAPRGDTIYRNDAGDQILRITPDGGITLYTVRAPNGTPASVAGPASPLSPPRLGPSELFRFALQQSHRMSGAVGHLIYVRLDLQRPGNESAVAEAVSVVTEAVLRLARMPGGPAGGIQRIDVVEGEQPSARFRNGALRIVIDPERGPAGRPSSALIIQAVQP